MIGARHTTKDGRTMLVEQMSDTHLINTFRMRMEGIQKYREYIEMGMKATNSFYVSSMKIENAKEQFFDMLRLSSPYILEMTLRGLMVGENHERLVSAVGRSEGIPSFDLQFAPEKLLTPPTTYHAKLTDDSWEDDDDAFSYDH